MALQVNGSIELQNGIKIEDAYVRTDVSLLIKGNQVNAWPTFWVDQAAFAENKQPLDFYVSANFSYEYDRAADGVDILTFANNKVKETLEGLGYTVTIVEI